MTYFYSDTHNNIGAEAAAPASGSISTRIHREGPFFRLDITLNAARIPVTDGAAAGSFGSLKLFDFVQGSVLALGGRQDFTGFVEGAALTTAAGDAAFEIGVGTTEIVAAADGVLAAANDNIIAALALTNSGGTTTGTNHVSASVAVDGTAAAKSLYLNWSGSALTIDANSTIDVSGTITVVGVMMNDD